MTMNIASRVMNCRFPESIAVLFSPVIYIVSLIMPKKRGLWMFGAWFGEKYSDNSRYLYEYAVEDGEIDAFWVTKNNQVVQKLNVKNMPVVHAYSLIGIWIQLRAHLVIMSVNSKDFYYATVTPRSIQIQLWHGTPIKKIGMDIEKGVSKYVNRLRRFFIDRYDAMISPSMYSDQIFRSAFGLDNSKLIRANYPRCDGFKISELERKTLRYAIGVKEDVALFIYLPTHRKEGRAPGSFKALCESLLSVSNRLIDANVRILIKPHPYEMSNARQLNDQIQNMLIYDEIEIYKLLACSDGLITDISSVAFDYETTGKPIIYFMPDWQAYVEHERELYIPISDLKSRFDKTEDAFVEEILVKVKNIVPYSLDFDGYECEERINSKDVFHKILMLAAKK